MVAAVGFWMGEAHAGQALEAGTVLEAGGAADVAAEDEPVEG